MKKSLLERFCFFVLDLLPAKIVSDYASEKLEMYDNDSWIDMQAGAAEARRG